MFSHYTPFSDCVVNVYVCRECHSIVGICHLVWISGFISWILWLWLGEGGEIRGGMNITIEFMFDINSFKGVCMGHASTGYLLVMDCFWCDLTYL